MRSNELRIGNYILVPTKGSQVQILTNAIIVQEIGLFGVIKYHVSPHIMHCPCTNVKNCAGIPLTGQWLKDFGFNKFPSDWIYNRDDFWACHLTIGKECVFKDLECSIKYVHQLQNLFFALTGTELLKK